MRRIDELAQALAKEPPQPRPDRGLAVAHRRSAGRGGQSVHQGARGTGPRHGGCRRHVAQANRAPGPYAGIPIALKGPVRHRRRTHASGVEDPGGRSPGPGNHRWSPDAAAGFIPVGRANMTSSLSPASVSIRIRHANQPWDRASSASPRQFIRHRGGVADGMAAAASELTPAVVPHPRGVLRHRRLKRRRGAFRSRRAAPRPLARSVGPLAPGVACCAAIDAILAGETPRALVPARLNGLRLAVPDTMVLDGIDATVAAAFETALSTLSAAGARIEKARFAASTPCPKSTPRRVRRLGGLCLAPPSAGDTRARLRPAHPRSHRPRRGHERGGLPGPDRRSCSVIAAFDAATAPYDCAVHADGAGRGAADCCAGR